MVKDNKKWYVLHVFSKQEFNVKRDLEFEIERKGLQDFFGEIFIPSRKVFKIVRNKKVETVESVHPGYIYIQMEVNEQTYSMLRGIKNFMSFLGPQGHPTPINKKNVLALKKVDSDNEVREVLFFDLQPGDSVLVKNGAFSGLSVKVESVDLAKCKLKAILPIFGRPSIIELSFFQVQKEGR